MKQQHFNSEV